MGCTDRRWDREPDNEVTHPCGVCGTPLNAEQDAFHDCVAEADDVERIIAAKNRYRADRDEAWAELENHVCAPGVPAEAVRELADTIEHANRKHSSLQPVNEAANTFPYGVDAGLNLAARLVRALVQRAAETNESGTP